MHVVVVGPFGATFGISRLTTFFLKLTSSQTPAAATGVAASAACWRRIGVHCQENTGRPPSLDKSLTVICGPLIYHNSVKLTNYRR